MVGVGGLAVGSKGKKTPKEKKIKASVNANANTNTNTNDPIVYDGEEGAPVTALPKKKKGVKGVKAARSTEEVIVIVLQKHEESVIRVLQERTRLLEVFGKQMALQFMHPSLIF
jgi:hypothetical protein